MVDPRFHYVSSTQSGALSGADGSGNGGTVTWTFTQAQLAAAQPALSFTVVVQPEQVTNNGTGVAAGTTVYAMTTAQSRQTRVQYNDGVSTYNQDNANSFNFVVGTASGAVITQVTANGTGEPGAVVEYQYTLKNTWERFRRVQFHPGERRRRSRRCAYLQCNGRRGVHYRAVRYRSGCDDELLCAGDCTGERDKRTDDHPQPYRDDANRLADSTDRRQRQLH